MLSECDAPAAHLRLQGRRASPSAIGRHRPSTRSSKTSVSSIHRGEFVCIIGHSGCGKTTILNILAGLDEASAGTVVMDGREMAGPSLDRGVVFQNHALLPWLTVAGTSRSPCAPVMADWSKAQVNAHGRRFVPWSGLKAGHRQEAQRSCPAA
jgi:ABC-type nitrate/sulfonate/bicarbonate transport system ATPase subunit